MFAFGAPSAPVANWGVLGFPEALTIYNFIYSRFPSTAGSGPSPSMATHFRRVGLGASCRIHPRASRLATDRPRRGAGGNLVLRREPRAACPQPTETPRESAQCGERFLRLLRTVDASEVFNDPPSCTPWWSTFPRAMCRPLRPLCRCTPGEMKKGGEPKPAALCPLAVFRIWLTPLYLVFYHQNTGSDSIPLS